MSESRESDVAAGTTGSSGGALGSDGGALGSGALGSGGERAGGGGPLGGSGALSPRSGAVVSGPLASGGGPLAPGGGPLAPGGGPLAPGGGPLAPGGGPLAPGGGPLGGSGALSPRSGALGSGSGPLAPGGGPLAPGRAPSAPRSDGGALEPRENDNGALVTLGVLAIVAGALPVVVAGALAATGRPDVELVLPLERALDVGLALAAFLVAVAWPFAALARGARDRGLRGRGLELAVLAAGVAPGLRLAALLSAESEASAARAFVGLAGLAVAQGGWLAALGRTRLARSTGVVLGVALTLGLPLVRAFEREADLELPRVARGSIVAAVLDALHGEGEPWGLVVATLIAALAVAGLTRMRGRRGATPSGRASALSAVSPELGVVVLAVSLAVGATASGQERPAGPLELIDVHPLLGPHDRPGELAPLRLELRAGPQGFEGEVGARGAGLLVLVRVQLAPLARGVVALPAIGDPSGSRLALEAWPKGREPVPLEPPSTASEPSPVQVWAPLPGELEGTPGAIARVVRNARTTKIVIGREDLDLLGVAGVALDAVGAPGGALRDPETRARLEAFVAAGGALAVDDPAMVEAFGEGRGAGPVQRSRALVQRGLGGGVVIAPLRPDGVAALGSELALRLQARARPYADSLADAVTRAPEPRVSAEVAARIAGHAALVAGVLGLVLVAQRRASPGALAGAFGVVALGLVVLVPRLVLGRARSPVILETSLVLDAPSGGSVAGETALLRFASTRSAPVAVKLTPATPIAAVLPDEAEAARSRAVFHWGSGGSAGAATLVPEAAALDFPLGRAAAVFLRRTSRALGGAVTLTRAEKTLVVRNGLAVALERPLVVEKEGIFALREVLGPGEETTVDLGSEPKPWSTFLSGEVARSIGGERGRWELLRAAFAPRAKTGALRLTAFLSLEPGRRTSDGVLEETAGPVVLVVRE